MSLCASCQEAAKLQAEAMRPRERTEGIVLLAKRDAFLAVGNNPIPELRMGDVISVSLVAGSVPDMGWCDNVDCDNK